ncbi:hypothetical protein NA57DRAFT_69412 [Rhizodiscina lignyota]|uniref:Zn(2)-C6 fungal-type domain-containing protein n=1 Tax=Rhizodiscina lignyota TaxID=1504668 RepID=A0A9P4I791_9PEZI|nr:hypothetical protein NA57DRAFT_69412 [Rhizodiscina lignyota]
MAQELFSETSASGSLGLSEQACNECRRRKAKCDRTLPECGLCVKHRRHCLYEQHSRTPLTRKHLTEVEERLRRAEIRAREAERRSDDADDGRMADGMAALTVEDEGGYLGSASGAALLRLLLPDAEIRRRGKLRRGVSSTQQPNFPDTDSEGWIPTPLYERLNISRIDLDSAIDAYFSTYHVSYPIVHEPSFRAQYSHLIPRPAGPAWNALAYMIAAIGAWTSTSGADSTDFDLFMAAKSNLTVDFLETGNITLVQVLTLMSNYLQKRNKPNSGYNYLGLALHIAMGLGLHKGFKNWNLPLLALETRRRVWWCLFIFYTGAAITFGRPLVLPHREAPLPLNVHDRELTNASKRLPAESASPTTHTSVATQARFHLATNEIYSRVISTPHIPAGELIRLDDAHIGGWLAALPLWYTETAALPPRYQFSHSVMMWRYRNFRIIMYRPFVIQRAFQAQGNLHGHAPTPEEQEAYDRCLNEARATIVSIHNFWFTNVRNRLSAWYALYFLFQASLIPCVCLRNVPSAPQAEDWRVQIKSALDVITNMGSWNSGSQDCFEVINQLTQISNVYSMLWPNVNANEMDLMLQDGAWDSFIGDDLDLQMDPFVGTPGTSGT